MGPSFALMAFVGRFHVARLLVRWLTRFRRSRSAPDPAGLSVGLLEPVDAVAAVESLRKHGVFGGLRLRERVCRELREALEAHVCYGAGLPEFPFLYGKRHEAERAYGRRFLQAHYYDLAAISPLVSQLVDDPLLQQIGRGHLGTEPVVIGLRAWWNFACGASEARQLASAGQSFHFDMDDYLVMSVFFYLTDVDALSGPHVCVRGSHLRKRFRDVWTPVRVRTDEEVLGFYDADAVMTLCGPAGYGFLEDPFCYHKGLHPEARDRLVIQIRYGLHDYGIGADEAHQAYAAHTHADSFGWRPPQVKTPKVTVAETRTR